jgi:copper chaperone CopZ
LCLSVVLSCQRELPPPAVAEIHITGMHCQGCAMTITEALANMDGVDSCMVSLTEKKATVHYQPARVDLTELLETINRLGFRTSLTRPRIQPEAGDADLVGEQPAAGDVDEGTTSPSGDYAADVAGVVTGEELAPAATDERAEQGSASTTTGDSPRENPGPGGSADAGEPVKPLPDASDD